MDYSEKDFELQWFSGTGKGGQHRNKHQNCCRVIHLPTGVRAIGASSRSRVENERIARACCIDRLDEYFAQPKERFRATDERVRTYHEPDNRVIDHASGESSTYKQVVLKSAIAPMIEARKTALGSEL